MNQHRKARECALRWVSDLLAGRGMDVIRLAVCEKAAEGAFLLYSEEWNNHDISDWKWPWALLDARDTPGSEPWAILLAWVIREVARRTEPDQPDPGKLSRAAQVLASHIREASDGGKFIPITEGSKAALNMFLRVSVPAKGGPSGP